MIEALVKVSAANVEHRVGFAAAQSSEELASKGAVAMALDAVGQVEVQEPPKSKVEWEEEDGSRPSSSISPSPNAALIAVSVGIEEENENAVAVGGGAVQSM